MEGALLMATAAAIPWKQIFQALPVIVEGAKALLKMTSKPKEPPLDPTQDLRAQLGTVVDRLSATEAAQAEQAKVVAEIAEQLQSIAIRSARGYWMAIAGLLVAFTSLAISVFRG
jgi:hypothetical protein